MEPRSQAVSILTEALMEDPQFTWVFPDAAARRVGQAFIYEPMATWASRAGRLHFADADAAALWIDVEAGQSPFDPTDAPTPEFPEILAPHVERLMALAEALAAHHPTDAAHTYLVCIGVLPGNQGRGLGSTLLERGLHAADTRGLPAYLEATTERSHRLYLRHGFADLGAPIRLPDGPSLWPMWREPAAATA